LLLTGCKKSFTISEKKVVLFQYDYINYAWGYQHKGFFIDNKGNVLVYNNPEEWNFPEDDLMQSESQIAENIANCMKSEIKISEEELQKYISYIKNISSSKVTAIKNVAADAGASKFICYQYSEDTEYYKGSLIKMEGDFTCENLNFFSKKVVLWMKDINNNLTVK
jgi:hypothetical protein